MCDARNEIQLSVREADFANQEEASAYLDMMDAFSRESTGGDPLAPAAREQLIGAMQRRSDVHVYLALQAGEIVGFANCVEGFSTFAARPLLNLHDLMVDRPHRRRGVARQLLEHVESSARKLGCCKLTLEVLSGNHGARALYGMFGFGAYALDPEKGEALFFEKELRD